MIPIVIPHDQPEGEPMTNPVEHDLRHEPSLWRRISGLLRRIR